MEGAHRKTNHPTRATDLKTEKACVTQGPEKIITWWDTPGDKPKTTTHMANRSKTKSSMVIEPKYTRVGHKPKIKTESLMAIRPKETQVVHKPRTKTESFMAIGPNLTDVRPQVYHKPRSFMSMLGSFMANGTSTSNIQQRGKNTHTYTVKSSRNGVSESNKRLSFLV